MIYGELRQQPPDSIDPLPSSSSNPPQVLCILAARILPNRPARIPRPDDPTPRKPSAYLNSSGSTNTKRKRDLSSTNPDIGHADSSKRARSIKGKGRAGEDDEDEQVKLAREVMLHLPKPVASGSSLPRLLGRDARPGKSTDTFKVPAVPVRAHSQPVGKDNPANHADVFGVEPGAHGSAAERPGSDELEKANKTVSALRSCRELALTLQFSGHQTSCYDMSCQTRYSEGPSRVQRDILSNLSRSRFRFGTLLLGSHFCAI